MEDRTGRRTSDVVSVSVPVNECDVSDTDMEERAISHPLILLSFEPNK